MTDDPAQHFRHGIKRELDHELRQHCIIWHSGTNRDDHQPTNDPPVSVELTDRSKDLLRQYAIALEIAEREVDDD